MRPLVSGPTVGPLARPRRAVGLLVLLILASGAGALGTGVAAAGLPLGAQTPGPARSTPAPAARASTAPVATAPPSSAPLASTPTASPTATRDSAPLVVHRRVVTVFRAPLGVLSPADRAAAAARRISALADTLADLPAAAGAAGARVTLRSVPTGVVVEAAGRGLFTLTPADVDTAGGGALGTEAASAAARLGTVLAAEREERSVGHLVRAAALAAGATLLFFVGLRVLRAVRALARRRLPAAAGPRLPGVAVGGFSLLTADQILALARRLVDLLAWATGLFGAYVWLAYVLTRFAYSRPWGEALGAYLVETVGTLAASALAGVPGLFTVVLIFVATRWATRVVGAFFDAVEAGRVRQPWVHPDTADPTKRIAVAGLWLLAVVVAYPYVPGSGSDVFKGVSVFAGLVLSLGSSGVVSQAMGGLVLMYARALKPGDYVRIGEVEGTVTALGMLSTKVRTPKREEVTLPNAVVVGASVKNFSRLAAESDGGGVIVHTAVTIGYDVPWRQVEAMLVLAARRTDGLLADPPPFVLKTGLSDFYVEYQLNAHLAEPHRRVPVLSALHGHVVDVFNEHEVQILSPHYVADPPSPAVVPRARWHATPAGGDGTGNAAGGNGRRAPAAPVRP